MSTDTKPRLASNRSPRWAFFDKFEVPNYDGPGNYLTRWRLLQTPWFGIMLHRFEGPDPRPTLHDHPWPFRSLVLRGGYIEATDYSDNDQMSVGDTWDLPDETHRIHSAWTMLRAGGWNVKAATDSHTIVKLLRVPTWTLFVGRRRRVWGYTDRDGTWTAFDEHRHNDEFLAALARRKAS